MRLTIVIPALNEEDAIADIIERTVAARGFICEHSPVREVEIVVVSDGSTDRTADIAGAYAKAGAIQLIIFEHNRGYGAAIKAGFARGQGELVGFLDADGTCEPRFFAELCRSLVAGSAHVAIGSRLHGESRMPRVRRFGNRAYAAILGMLSNRRVTDTASGMRVIRRDALPRLYPLPDRLNFTPAMSARVLMDDSLRIIERPMPYRERVGRSKLSVLRDGARFLQTIGQMALVWNPQRVFGAGAVACFAVMMLLALHPVEQWIRAGRLGEDTIYRLLFCMWLGCVGGTLLAGSAVMRTLGSWLGAEPARDFDHRRESVGPQPTETYVGHVLDRLYTFRTVGTLGVLSIVPLGWLVGPGLWTRVTSGHMEIHWSRVVLAGLIAFTMVQLLTTTLVANVVRFHRHRHCITDETARAAMDAPPANMSTSEVSSPSRFAEPMTLPATGLPSTLVTPQLRPE
ncbi:MAG: glycosyltransferase family 2 protein [Phycisphaerales bacterium]|nr:glycosyltransferase family 2 protein [Phycisphaerales bacterium]